MPADTGRSAWQLKNALDWASRPYDHSALQGKPVAVTGALAEAGGVQQEAA
jgi:NAD(P)H-dependent FMN reductase